MIYSYGVYDLLHYGHLRAIKKAKALGDELIIGVFTDKVAERFKRKPVLNQKERFMAIKELGWGRVVYQKTFLPTDSFLKNNKIDIVAKAEGAGWDYNNIPKWKGIKSILLPYTNGISTSDIIKRVYDYKQQSNRKTRPTKRHNNKS